jgi:hypothetical protein
MINKCAFCLVILASLGSQAQVVVANGLWTFVTTAPSGSCSQNAQPQLVMGPGTLYTCQTGTWALVSGAGGGVTSVSGTVNQIDSTGGNTPVLSLDSALIFPGTISTGAFLADFSAGTMEIPEGAGFVTNVNSTIGTDTNTLITHLWGPGSADAFNVVSNNSCNTTTFAPFATTTPGLYTCRAVAAGDLPTTLTSGTAITNAALTTPALGTPSSGTGTNLTGIPLSGVVSPTGAITEIQNGDNAFLMSSATTTSGRVAVGLNEHTASTSAGTPYQVQALTLAGSTATPLNVTNSVTGSQTLPVVAFTPTWNTSAAAIGIQEVITNTASASVSRALDIKLGATNFFYVSTQSGTPATAATVGPNLNLNGSKPAITTPGTTPYLNMNTLVNGTLNKCSFALTVSTFTLALSPVSLCTYTLPAAAVAWYWNCDIYWSNVAGTTPTYAIGVTWAQAPSIAGQGAWIDTTNTNTGTALFTSTTTNANILASPTLTNSATVFQSHASGTFTGSATSGTFSPTVSLTGTGATGTAVGGCTIQ